MYRTLAQNAGWLLQYNECLIRHERFIQNLLWYSVHLLSGAIQQFHNLEVFNRHQCLKQLRNHTTCDIVSLTFIKPFELFKNITNLAQVIAFAAEAVSFLQCPVNDGEK